MSQQMEAVCDQEVSNLRRKKAILVASNTPGFVSRIFAIPKKSGGYRSIINLKNINQHIHYSHFKMEVLDIVKSLLKNGDWMAKLDLRDAYLTVPVCKAHQPFLRFRRIAYQFFHAFFMFFRWRGVKIFFERSNLVRIFFVV